MFATKNPEFQNTKYRDYVAKQLMVINNQQKGKPLPPLFFEDENGKTQYVKVGVVKVDSKYPIWDNTYGAQEENPNSTVDRTYFKKVSGKDFFPGMLLVQKKGK